MGVPTKVQFVEECIQVDVDCYPRNRSIRRSSHLETGMKGMVGLAAFLSMHDAD